MVAPILNPSWALAKILNWKPLQFMGRISYGIYIWQELFLFDTSSSAERRWVGPLAITGILIVAWLSEKFLERPFRAFGHRLAAESSAIEFILKRPGNKEESEQPRNERGLVAASNRNRAD